MSEGSGENLFIIKKRCLVTTPPAYAGALEGITKDTVITIMREITV